MSSAAPNKKSKTSQEAETEALRQYLLDCPVVPKNSRAVQVALDALDQERKRMERDAKLQRKFANTNDKVTGGISGTSNGGGGRKAETLPSSGHVSYPSAAFSTTTTTTTTSQKEPLELKQNEQEEDAELMEWQDVAPDHSQEGEHIVEARPLVSMEGSVLGKVLAQSAISEMAKSKTSVSSPLGAAALALHAALVGETLGFKCTGIPNDGGGSSSKGFAAPIRELPKNQLVPNEWDKHSVVSPSTVNPTVKLRYRKDGVGSTVLQVSLHQEGDSMVVHVELIPSSTGEPHVLTFPLSDHVNLDSLSKALAKDGRVVPTLHYKALPVLLTNMCNTFDLGPVKEDTVDGVDQTATLTSLTTLPYVDTTIAPPTTNPTIYSSGTTSTDKQPSYPRYDQHAIPSVRDFQPAMRRPVGDFNRDLYPGGVVVDDNAAPGNLLGPNHPIFVGGGVQPPAVGGGGYGMRPRFDPFGPPGGPQDPRNIDDNVGDDPNRLLDPTNPRGGARGQRGPRPPPGGLGDPNHDHARPPSNLNHNMFM